MLRLMIGVPTHGIIYRSPLRDPHTYHHRLSLSVKETTQNLLNFVCSYGSDDSEAKEDGKKKKISC